MAILKRLLLLLVCVALISGGISSASMAACCEGEQGVEALQADDMQAMPCHQLPDDKQMTMNDCDGCGCMHYVPMVVPALEAPFAMRIPSGAVIAEVHMLYMIPADVRFHPPKNLS